MGTGILHSAVAAPLFYQSRWLSFLKKGLFNVSPHSLSEDYSMTFSDIGSEAAIWFFVGGILFFLVGQLMHSLEKKLGRLPTYVGWELLAIGCVFGWMVPQSGFTLLIVPQAIYILARFPTKKGSR